MSSWFKRLTNKKSEEEEYSDFKLDYQEKFYLARLKSALYPEVDCGNNQLICVFLEAERLEHLISFFLVIIALAIIAFLIFTVYRSRSLNAFNVQTVSFIINIHKFLINNNTRETQI